MGPFSNLHDLPLFSSLGVATLLLAAALFLYVLIIFNGLVRLKVNIDKAWANLDVLLKQRHDEVPNLVAMVVGIKDFEAAVMTQVTEARGAAQQASGPREKGQAEAVLSQGLGRLFAVAEHYPTLRAQESFLMLQKRLSGLEDGIADRRTFYNETVAAYNARIQEFPDALLAGPFGFRPRTLFQAGPEGKDMGKLGLAQ